MSAVVRRTVAKSIASRFPSGGRMGYHPRVGPSFLMRSAADAVSAPCRRHPLCLSSVTVSGRSFSASAELSALLRREEEEETDAASTEMNEPLSELKNVLESERGWTIVDEDDGKVGVVKMFATMPSGSKTTVVFHCQDSVEEPPPPEDGEDDDAGGEEEDDEPSQAIRFAVTVSKAGKSLVFSCVSEDAQAFIESVAVTTGELDSVLTTGKIAPELYQGPVFSELAEDVQEGFTSMLRKDCGVDSDVASFIAMYADLKEQRSYVHWLKQTQTILS